MAETIYLLLETLLKWTKYYIPQQRKKRYLTCKDFSHHYRHKTSDLQKIIGHNKNKQVMNTKLY